MNMNDGNKNIDNEEKDTESSVIPNDSGPLK